MNDIEFDVFFISISSGFFLNDFVEVNLVYIQLAQTDKKIVRDKYIHVDRERFVDNTGIHLSHDVFCFCFSIFFKYMI